MSMLHPMELLAPAGNAETALAALDAGADAIYCGLGRFNARARAENFTPDTMAGIISLFHERGKKVYLTLNTLIYESELPKVVETLGEISQLMPDALIVQDLGVAAIVRKYFPELALHASTQMGIHNSDGVAFAAKLGFRRVILERQIPLPELKEIAVKSPVELEVFIHGSLCCSLSGRCLLSHHLFGAGGNRGVCKQPCRRAYDHEYRLSPADLSGVSVLPELRKMGIASLKIEGRLRPPEYVWKCTRAYRMLLDAPEFPDDATLRAAQVLLDSASGRASDSGFFDPGRYQKLIDVRRPGIFGIPTGTVLNVKNGAITVKLQSKLHLGDRLRLVPPEGGEGESFSLISMRNSKGSLLRAQSGATVEIATTCRVSQGAQLFKIGENGFDFSRQLKNLPPRREKIDLKITVSARRWCVASSRLKETWCKAVDFAPAKQHALDEAAVKDVFVSGIPELYCAGKVDVSVEGNFFVPASVIKAIRREFWASVSEKILPEVDHAADAIRHFTADHEMRKATCAATPENIQAFFHGFLPEEKLKAEHARFVAAQKAGKIIALEGLHTLNWLAGNNRNVVTRFPIAVTNSFAAKLLADMGVAAVEAAPELPPRELENLVRQSPLPLLPARDVPLLVTRLPLVKGVWHDASHRAFLVRKNEEGLSVVEAVKSVSEK